VIFVVYCNYVNSSSSVCVCACVCVCVCACVCVCVADWCMYRVFRCFIFLVFSFQFCVPFKRFDTVGWAAGRTLVKSPPVCKR